jgi:hypothetical protein
VGGGRWEVGVGWVGGVGRSGDREIGRIGRGENGVAWLVLNWPLQRLSRTTVPKLWSFAASFRNPQRV